MWLGKFLDLEDDMKELKSSLVATLKKDKLTPLEFTILENIFNSRAITGYDLIQSLNKTFAGTWEATSGTVYPILSKLKKNGFLDLKTVKSPIGPLRKVYFLTLAGESVLKMKVNRNFLDQVKFTENFLLELASIYIHSFPDTERKDRIVEVQNLLKESFQSVVENLPTIVKFKARCPECGSEIERGAANYCAFCGATLFPTSEKVNN